MDARKAVGNGRRPVDATTQRELWLLGQPPLGRYLDFVEDFVIDGKEMRRGDLIEEWRQANDYYYELETSEANIADHAEVRPVDSALQPLVRAVEEDARFQRSYDELPTRIAMVELEKTVVPQPHVNLDHVERLKARLSANPSGEALFRFCLPLDRDEAPVRTRRMGGGRFQFWSPSSDFRFLEDKLLHGDETGDLSSFGPIASALSLLVGYGSNFLTAIESDGRLLLHNGHHRAYALRDLGITHAPCIIQTVTRRDELNLVASRSVTSDPAFYFKASRPPLLKDFFDPKIRKVLRVPPIVRLIELSFEVKETEIRDFAFAD